MYVCRGLSGSSYVRAVTSVSTFFVSGYLNLQPPEYENVVRDCDEALKLDSTYIKVRWDSNVRNERNALEN